MHLEMEICHDQDLSTQGGGERGYAGFSKAGYLQACAVGDVQAAQLSQHGQAPKAGSGHSSQSSAAPQAQVPQVLQRRQLADQLISHIGLQL